MSDEEVDVTSDERVFSMKWSKFIPMVLGLLLATNTVTGLVFNQEKNTDNIDYNDNKTGRKIEQGDETSKMYSDHQLLQYKYEVALEEIEDLKEELKDKK